MKILFISTPLSWRGGEQQLLYLIDQLYLRGIEFGIVCPRESELFTVLKKRNYTCYPYKRKGLAKISLALFIARVAGKYKYQILHANDSHAHGGAITSSVFGCFIPVVLHRRVDFPVGRNWFSFKKYNASRIKAIICISEEVKRVILPSIRNKSKIHVIYSAIDPERFHLTNSSDFDLRKRFNIPANNKLVGMVAALAPHKDYVTFVETAEKVLRNYNDVTFLAIGEGECRQKIEKNIDTKNLNDKVILTGFIKDIDRVLPQLDCFLLTSETEGMGTSLLDAYSCLIPVVATNAGGIGEIVIDGKTGLLAPVRDSSTLAWHVIHVLKNKNIAFSLAKAGREQLNNFSIKGMTDKTISVYRKIIES